jgi:hypothetical protein
MTIKIDKIINLDQTLTKKIVGLYTTVFSGEPWNEVFKCDECGIAYSDKDNLVKLARGGICTKNDQCNMPIKLIPFYSGEDKLGEKIYLDAINKKGFVGVAGLKNDELIGFSWGYAMQEKDTPSVMFTKINPLFEEQGYDRTKVFYAAETGIVENFRQNGFGTSLIKGRLLRAKECGFESVSFRTKNAKLVSIFENMFGRINLVGYDKDPAKQNVMWYAGNFGDMKKW